MTADAKTNKDSSENTELEKTEAECKENEIETTRQTGDMPECSLCQVKEDAPKKASAVAQTTIFITKAIIINLVVVVLGKILDSANLSILRVPHWSYFATHPTHRQRIVTLLSSRLPLR